MEDDPPQIGRELTFLSAWFCPFAQRTWIALEEKKLNYKLVEVAIKDARTGLWKQLNEKPEWFTRLSPLGKVPCLAYREENGEIHSVYESLICNEFLEEFASPPAYQAIFPHNPAEKAQARIIIDRFDRKFIPNFYGILSKPPELRHRCREILSSELLWLETQLDQSGPYFLGQQFSAIDCAILPWFLRLYILKHFRDFELPKHCKRLINWYNEAMTRDCIQATLQSPDPDEGYESKLLEHYAKYADGTANSTSAKEFGARD